MENHNFFPVQNITIKRKVDIIKSHHNIGPKSSKKRKRCEVKSQTTEDKTRVKATGEEVDGPREEASCGDPRHKSAGEYRGPLTCVGKLQEKVGGNKGSKVKRTSQNTGKIYHSLYIWGEMELFHNLLSTFFISYESNVPKSRSN